LYAEDYKEEKAQTSPPVGLEDFEAIQPFEDSLRTAKARRRANEDQNLMSGIFQR
jgi:hypothetical protein